MTDPVHPDQPRTVDGTVFLGNRDGKAIYDQVPVNLDQPYTPYTPSVDELREVWAQHRRVAGCLFREADFEFDRMLASVRRYAQAEAIDALKLDPEPMRSPFTTKNEHRHAYDAVKCPRLPACIFLPRPGYSQNESDYR